MNKGLLKLQLLVVAMLCLSVQQTIFAVPTVKFKKAKVSYVDLSDNAKITAQPVITNKVKLKKGSCTDTAIVVNLNKVIHSSLMGIGGAFNEQGGEAFMTLPESERNTLAKALFNTKTGSGLAFCRTAVGASDFGLGAYSYSETPEDYEMKHFSVDRDKKSVIPFIVAAKKENPDMKMFASPWSPPAWMKVTGKMDGGEKNDSTNVLKSDPEIYKAYALYLSKYVQAYAKNGVEINRLVVQNETDMNTKYPSCDMKPAQMAELVTNYIRPQFIKDALKTEIWAGTFRKHRADAQNFMKLSGAKDVTGVGLQYCSPKTMEELRSSHPDLKMMHTEGACFNGENSMAQARTRFAEMAMWINSGCDNYCYWNIALNEDSKSGWGWKQNSLINIDRKAGVVTYNPDYAPVALLSQFIRPGNECLQVETAKNEVAIAIRSGKQLVVLVQNKTEKVKSQHINIGGKVYTVDLPAQSVCAVTF